MNKLYKIDDAINLIKDGDFVAASGFMLATCAEELFFKLEEKFLREGTPRNLTFMQAAGLGNTRDQGTYHISHEGLIKRYITGHFASNQRMIDLVNQNKVEAYNFPQGVICHLYRAAAAGKSGELTRIGLKTYVDPRLEGGKMNSITTEDLVQAVNVAGEELLFYKSPKIDVAIIRGTTSDEYGNITMEDESACIDALDVALAAKNNGGKVIVQVKNYVKSSSVDRTKVVIPGNLVDAVVITSDAERFHRQTPGEFYSPVLAGYYKLDNVGFGNIELNERKIIARRAAMELKPRSVVNLGIGIPEGIASIAAEEGIGEELTLTIESGLIGGVPTGGPNFGSAINAWAALPMTSQFDLYNGGGLNMTFLGFAEVNSKGDINVSKFGTKIAGCGGFIDISQSTKKIVFCGTFTAGKFEMTVEKGQVKIIKEGVRKKFIDSIEQITFSSEFVSKYDQDVMFITERCVFRLTDEGLVLIEVAPGIDVEKDIISHMEYRPIISKDLKLMDEKIFKEEKIGLESIVMSK
ncbi:CoA-transferase [Proteiniborus sp. MB09-C3]|uniref:acyl CoA:acetate/3-ketoacid CoA transferase n=1 Tax=Proteiniborus sp. MB09-C3 TaxID=3050072 RepID=UPI002555099E|nr:CoA-transferase [Proteiniborus sp. MB09-C3]WIV10417.1 CoA-transferase [Proteiniborus sp. MB09-C3]